MARNIIKVYDSSNLPDQNLTSDTMIGKKQDRDKRCHQNGGDMIPKHWTLVFNEIK